MAKRPIVVDTTIDSPLAAFGVNLAKDVPIPKADAPRLASTNFFVFFVFFVVQILLVIGLRAKPAPGLSWPKFFCMIQGRWLKPPVDRSRSTE